MAYKCLRLSNNSAHIAGRHFSAILLKKSKADFLSHFSGSPWYSRKCNRSIQSDREGQIFRALYNRPKNRVFQQNPAMAASGAGAVEWPISCWLRTLRRHAA